MNWYLTWQDGVAVLLALMGLLFAWWLHRKAATPHGCGRCPMLENDRKVSSPPEKP